MSADNRICVLEDNGQWYVWEGSLSCEYFEPPYGAEFFHTQKEAFEYVDRIVRDINILEGGVTRIDNSERLTAINYELERLNNLKASIELKLKS